MTPDELQALGLPEMEAAGRFLDNLREQNASHADRLLKRKALLSDVLTLVSFSPLLAATLLQNPEYIWWLERRRGDSGIRSKEELIESLAQFMMTNSQLEPQVAFARFRRRELLRIYLRDIRRLAAIVEVTEEISNLADAVLETALNLARHEVDERFGLPFESDDNGRDVGSLFCIVALGKLGSRELNYSSDIDLLFIYSGEGTTSGGSRGPVTNREYFVKLAEVIVRLVGQPSGEGAAYRVDLRLRPHGTMGALALSLNDTINYYIKDARSWERQVLIRSRAAAGEGELFRKFYSSIERYVYPADGSVEQALRNVKLSKEEIDRQSVGKRGFNVKLGRGGIREIEFIAQALQLAFGGKDKWLRSPHTLISLSRLEDRGLISDTERTQLHEAYDLLRRIEHVLQMENGVQTHTVPYDPLKRTLLAARMSFAEGIEFEAGLNRRTADVHAVYSRIFGTQVPSLPDSEVSVVPKLHERTRARVMDSIEKSDLEIRLDQDAAGVLDRVSSVSPHFAHVLAANPSLVTRLAEFDAPISENDYRDELSEALLTESEFGRRLAILRRTWARLILEIAVRDIFERITVSESKRLQTILAEECIGAALLVTRDQLASKFKTAIDQLPLIAFALGKLGSRGLDYDSDLDMILIFDESAGIPDVGVSQQEYYSRAAEIFITVLSSMTRDGNLYRVDLRLRPHGKNGQLAISTAAFNDYLAGEAAIWELLAYVKIRAVGGDSFTSSRLESEVRNIIHRRAVEIGEEELREETIRIRLKLEKQRSRARRSRDIDIKFGSGGMLDVYFASRYLQLCNDMPDEADDRSTERTLLRLEETGLLTHEQHTAFAAGYAFLSELDHNLRLTIGRTTRVPLANEATLGTIAARMGTGDAASLIERLTLHLIEIRETFNAVMGTADG